MVDIHVTWGQLLMGMACCGIGTIFAVIVIMMLSDI
jgi:hypothetical protein